MAQSAVMSSPSMPRAPVKARISPPSKAVQERVIKQCMQRLKTQRRGLIEASRRRGLLDLDPEQQVIFRGLLFEQLQQEEAKMDGAQDVDQRGDRGQAEVSVEEDELDEADELLQALGKDNYDEFMIWLEQGLRAELEMMDMQQAAEEAKDELDEFEELEERELAIASQLTEVMQADYVLCPQCKEHPLNSLGTVYSCDCGINLPSDNMSIEDLRFLLRSVLDTHRQACAADVIFQQHKAMLYAYCWECGLVEPVCAAFEGR